METPSSSTTATTGSLASLSPLLELFLSSCKDHIWEFLDIQDILQLSSTSHTTADLYAPPDVINRYTNVPDVNAAMSLTSTPTNIIQDKIQLPWRLNFIEPIAIGVLRRTFYLLQSIRKVDVEVDPRSGKVSLSIGTAYAESAPTVFKLASASRADEEGETDLENQQIFKHLEICSYDEYDDFNPRHPLPKDRAHRRGDSYFNSDIDSVVGQLGNISSPATSDLRSAARSALADEGAPAAASNSNAARNRILGRARNNYPGRGALPQLD